MSGVLRAGQTVTVTIEKPAAGGRMIARVGGQVILVAGAIPGERVVIRVDRIGRGVAYAETIQVEEASSDRRISGVDPACAACGYAHVAYRRQLELKGQVIADAFERIARLPLSSLPAVHGSAEHGYRMRARLHLRGGRLGFFREGTHTICDFRSTGQLLPETCDAVDRLEARMRQARFLPDCEIEVSENIDASERVAHIEFQATAATAATAATVVPDGLAPDDLTGLVVSSRRDGRVRSTVVSGDAHVTDRVPVEHHHVRLRRHVLAFFQGNRFLLSALVSQVLSHVREGASVVDLYAGVGLFAVSAAAVRGARVTAVEGSRVSASDLACNADGMLEPVCDSVERFLGVANKAADVVIADPPRTGLSQDALEGIVRLGAPTFAYVSCDVATLARDARALCAAGYRLDGLVGFDLFPNTPHVETVATFTRDHVAGA